MPKTITIQAETTLTDQDVKYFFDFLTVHKTLGISYFKKGTVPSFSGNTIVFEQDFLCEYAVDGAYIGNFVGKKIGDGSFACVYHIDKVVKINDIEFLPSGYTQPQALKIQQHCACGMERKLHSGVRHHTLHELWNEFELSSITPHLAPCQPIIENIGSIKSYTLMNEIAGVELFDILHDDVKKSPLNLQQRMDLSVAILQAVLNQVKRLGLIHRDLKPENIKVDMAPPIKVNIIDYGFAIKLPPGKTFVYDAKHCGTPSYMAPEVVRSTGVYRQTSAVDVFAVGRILAIIWGDLYNSYHKATIAGDVSHIDPEYLQNLPALFTQLPKDQFAKLNAWKLDESIKSMLKQMLSFKPTDRISIELAFISFQELQELLQQCAALPMPEVIVAPKNDPRFFAKTSSLVLPVVGSASTTVKNAVASTKTESLSFDPVNWMTC